MYVACSKAGGAKPPKFFGSKVPEVGHELLDLLFALLDFGLTMPHFSLLEWECSIVSWKYVICLLILKGLQTLDSVFSNSVKTVKDYGDF